MNRAPTQDRAARCCMEPWPPTPSAMNRAPTPRTTRPRTRCRLPPDCFVDVVGEVFVFGGADVGGEVFAAAVGEEEDDVASLHALGVTLGDAEDGAGADAGEDTSLLQQLLGGGKGVGGIDDDAVVEDVG